MSENAPNTKASTAPSRGSMVGSQKHRAMLDAMLTERENLTWWRASKSRVDPGVGTVRKPMSLAKRQARAGTQRSRVA